jgi:hypothetical protein
MGSGHWAELDLDASTLPRPELHLDLYYRGLHLDVSTLQMPMPMLHLDMSTLHGLCCTWTCLH